MAKDRFLTRRNYDLEFKYGSFYTKPLPKRTITEEQTIIMRSMLRSGRLNNWETKFVANVMKSSNLSDKQKEVLNTLYKKTR